MISFTFIHSDPSESTDKDSYFTPDASSGPDAPSGPDAQFTADESEQLPMYIQDLSSNFLQQEVRYI